MRGATALLWISLFIGSANAEPRTFVLQNGHLVEVKPKNQTSKEMISKAFAAGLVLARRSDEWVKVGTKFELYPIVLVGVAAGAIILFSNSMNQPKWVTETQIPLPRVFHAAEAESDSVSDGFQTLAKAEVKAAFEESCGAMLALAKLEKEKKAFDDAAVSGNLKEIQEAEAELIKAASLQYGKKQIALKYIKLVKERLNIQG